jgi:hypothetical protein
MSAASVTFCILKYIKICVKSSVLVKDSDVSKIDISCPVSGMICYRIEERR